MVLLCHHISKFLSTLSLRRASDNLPPVDTSSVSISIHALLTESDVESRSNILITSKIFLSTLSLRRATVGGFLSFPNSLFLSTLSLRRATVPSSLTTADCPYFYPRSPYGCFCCRVQISSIQYRPGKVISIHALLTESDTHRILLQACKLISIHALLTESDIRSTRIQIFFFHHFYPRSPYGERRHLLFNDTIKISIHALLTESDLGLPFLQA